MARTITVKQWTEFEDLMVLYAPYTDRELADLLGPPRTAQSVKMRRYCLKNPAYVRRPRAPQKTGLEARSGRRWSAEEDAVILDPNRPPDALIAANLNRTALGVATRRHKQLKRLSANAPS